MFLRWQSCIFSSCLMATLFQAFPFQLAKAQHTFWAPNCELPLFIAEIAVRANVGWIAIIVCSKIDWDICKPEDCSCLLQSENMLNSSVLWFLFIRFYFLSAGGCSAFSISAYNLECLGWSIKWAKLYILSLIRKCKIVILLLLFIKPLIFSMPPV